MTTPTAPAVTGRPLLRLLPVLRHHRTGLAATTAAATLNQATAVGMAVAGAVVVGGVAAGRDPTTPAVVLVALAAVRSLLAWVESWAAHHLAFRVMTRLRVEAFDGIERLAPAWLNRKRTGDVATAAMSDVEALEWFYAHTIAQLAVLVAAPAACLAALATIEVRMALLLAPFVLGVAVVPVANLRRGDRDGQRVRDELANLQADAVEGIQGRRDLVALGAGGAWLDQLSGGQRRLAAVRASVANRTGIEAGVTESLVAGGMLAVLWYSAVLARRGDLDAVGVSLAVVLASAALGPVISLIGGLRNLGVLRATASRVVAVIDTPVRVVDGTGVSADGTVVAASDPATGRGPEVVFDEVRFGYDDGTEVLRGVSFVVPAGSTVALVGSSGAGKSTCANLLLRFWDPWSGSIRVAGTDLRDLPLDQLRQLVSLVPQDPYLFHGTLADNLRLAAPDADGDRLRAAAGKALVTEFTDRFEAGLDHPVGERGGSLSGGQRQRVSLAQAFLRQAPVLVLDEAVANVDVDDEAVLHRAMATARRSATTIVIAHRLSTIAQADQVVFLDGGRVAATGTHEQLLETEPAYRAMLGGQLIGPDGDGVLSGDGEPTGPDSLAPPTTRGGQPGEGRDR